MRKQLDVPIESRDGNKTLTQDSKLSNFMKDPLYPEKILKRPGMWQSNVFAPTGQGYGTTAYNDVIYSWTSGNTATTPTTGVIDETIMVRGVLNFVDNGDGTYTLTLSPDNPYAVNDSLSYNGVVVNPGSGYMVTDVNGSTITIQPFTHTFIVGGESASLATSSDGVTWAPHTPWSSSYVFAIAVSNSQYVAVGAAANIATSPDGVTWTPQSNPFSGNINCVIYAGGLYIAAGDSGELATSSDGITWNLQTSSFGTNAIYGLAYGNGVYVAVGDLGTVASSINGTAWTQKTNPFGASSTVYCATYGNGLFLIGGRNGGTATLAATSSDGSTWSDATGALGGFMRGCCYGGGYYMFAGNGGFVYRSADGSTWTTLHTGLGSNDFNAIIYASNKFMVCGGLNSLYTSSTALDGSWTSQNAGFSGKNLMALSY